MESRPVLLAGLVAIAWLGVICFGFWHYSLRYQHSAADYWATFDGSELARITPAGKVTVIHWVDPDCPCSRFSAAHISELEARYPAVIQQRVVSTTDPEAMPPALARSFEGVPATPAVAVYDETGGLAYFGPYSSGAVCGSGTDLVARVLTQLDQGVNPGWINQEAIGCMCRWPGFKTTKLETAV